MLAAIVRRYTPNHFICLASRLVRIGNRRAVAKPDVDVREVLNVLGKECAAEVLPNDEAQRQEGERAGYECLAMLQRIASALATRKTLLTTFVSAASCVSFAIKSGLQPCSG